MIDVLLQHWKFLLVIVLNHSKTADPCIFNPFRIRKQINGLVQYLNLLNKFMHSIAEEGGLDTASKNFTNHSVCKTVVMKLKRAGVASRDITAITGHESEESLKSYDENDLADHKKLSNIIAGKDIESEMIFSSQQTITQLNAMHSISRTSINEYSIASSFQFQLATTTSTLCTMLIPSLCTTNQYDNGTKKSNFTPTYTMNNCTVYLAPDHAPIPSELSSRKRKRPIIIDSDDSD